MLDRGSLSAYLHFGYLPMRECCLAGILHDGIGCSERLRFSNDLCERKLPDEGAERLRETFREAIHQVTAGKIHILPLSGGLDSRAVLGGLLENLDSTQIQAVTFGAPGTWDYDIGRSVARAADVRCEAIDLTSSHWCWDTAELVKTASATQCPVWVFDAHVNRSIAERFGSGCVYWSGFMGDPLAGSHLLQKDSGSWGKARMHFVERNRFCRSTCLTPAGFRAMEYLPKAPLADDNTLSYDEQLDFGVRQQNLIRHIVLPKGYDYRTPFLHPEWVRFILGVPRCYREKQFLYKEILKAAYPKLFWLPTKNGFGLPLTAPSWRQNLRRQGLRARAAAQRCIPWVDWGISRSINYIDFDRGLRERRDLQAVVYENIQDLKRRDLVDWVDIDAIWDRHQRRCANHADALTLLASLEINLKARKIQVAE